MSESINYSEVLEVNTGKKNQAEYIYLFFFLFLPCFRRLILLVLALLIRCDKCLPVFGPLSFIISKKNKQEVALSHGCWGITLAVSLTRW